MLIELLVVYAIIITILFFYTGKRMERSNDDTLEAISEKISAIKPEKIRIEVDTSPWNDSKRVPVEEEEALIQMWQALCTRGLVGDHVDRFQAIFGSEDFNRIPLPDGRMVVWYGNTMPSYIRQLINNPLEEETDEFPIVYAET